METEDLALLAVIIGGVASLLTVMATFGAKWIEQRYIAAKAVTEATAAAVGDAATREDTAHLEASALMERYATRLEAAYDRERARRELSDEEVARLRLEVVALRFQVSQLNEQLARLTGMPLQMQPPPLAPTRREPIETNAVEKREAVVGPKPEGTNGGK